MSYDSLLHEYIFFSFKLLIWQVILSSNVPKKQTTQFCKFGKFKCSCFVSIDEFVLCCTPLPYFHQITGS